MTSIVTTSENNIAVISERLRAAGTALAPTASNEQDALPSLWQVSVTTEAVTGHVTPWLSRDERISRVAQWALVLGAPVTLDFAGCFASARTEGRRRGVNVRIRCSLDTADSYELGRMIGLPLDRNEVTVSATQLHGALPEGVDDPHE